MDQRLAEPGFVAHRRETQSDPLDGNLVGGWLGGV
jgi:hypothetical protein